MCSKREEKNPQAQQSAAPYWLREAFLWAAGGSHFRQLSPGEVHPPTRVSSGCCRHLCLGFPCTPFLSAIAYPRSNTIKSGISLGGHDLLTLPPEILRALTSGTAGPCPHQNFYLWWKPFLFRPACQRAASCPQRRALQLPCFPEQTCRDPPEPQGSVRICGGVDLRVCVLKRREENLCGFNLLGLDWSISSNTVFSRALSTNIIRIHVCPRSKIANFFLLVPVLVPFLGNILRSEGIKRIKLIKQDCRATWLLEVSVRDGQRAASTEQETDSDNSRFCITCPPKTGSLLSPLGSCTKTEQLRWTLH